MKVKNCSTFTFYILHFLFYISIMMMGIDIGTSGTKAIAFTASGDILFSAYEAYDAISWHPDQNELDPALLLTAVIRVIKAVSGHTDARDLLGISFSCALHSLICVNEKGIPLTNALTWADARSKDYAAKLKLTPKGKEIYKRTGTPIHPMSPLCKIMWFRDKQPEIFANTYKFISIKEYVWFSFFGKYEVDYSIASGTGLLDIEKLQWYDGSLLEAGITVDRLSIPVSPTFIERALHKSIQKKTGLPDGVPFIIGGNDGCLANLGCNAVNPGDLALTIGTSGAVRMVAPAPTYDEKERIFNYILTESQYVSGGAINNGGVAVKWYVENFMGKKGESSRDFAAILAEADKVVPGSEGLIFLPYLLGERAPVWDADAKGVFFGIYSGHTMQHFLRSLIEGISFSLYQIGLCLEEMVGPIERIYASGGFIQSESWLQMLADIFNRKVYVTNSADASAIGAAILGLYAIGELSSLPDAAKMINVRQTYSPVEAHHKIYMKNYSVFAVLYDKLKHEFTELSNLRRPD